MKTGENMILLRKAILMIHGFAGGTYDQEFLANYLEKNKKLDVYTYTLPGHSHILNNKSTCEEWLKASKDMIDMLLKNGYQEIDIIGHSMGGVIATYLAAQYKQVKKLVLVAPAFRYFNIEDCNINILDILKLTPEILSQYGKDEVTSRLTKLPFATVKEFIKLVADYQEIPQKVHIPTLIIQGLEDKVVPPGTAKYLYDKLATDRKKIIYVGDCTHDLLRESKKEVVSHIIEIFLTKGISKIETTNQL